MNEIRYHKNTKGIKCYYAIGVMENNIVKFVTEIEGSAAFWNDGESVRKFESKTIVDEIALGLNYNGYTAFVLEIPYYVDKLLNN